MQSNWQHKSAALMELKSWKGSGYKELARHTRVRECHINERPFSRVAVDVRSRTFRYIRLCCCEAKLWIKIERVFGIILNGVEAEVRKVFYEALQQMKSEVEIMSIKEASYVLCPSTPCPYKESLRHYRAKEKLEARQELDRSLESYKRDLLKIKAILGCYAAFERYLITHIEEVCLSHRSEALPALHVFPKEDDSFEPDRLCATMGADAVLSEDLDCVALFGARIMIKEVSLNTVSYVALSDVVNKFQSHNREDVVYKCCMMGTDYNLGTRGIGPARVNKIDLLLLREKAELCLSSQSIDVKNIRKFFLIG